MTRNDILFKNAFKFCSAHLSNWRGFELFYSKSWEGNKRKDQVKLSRYKDSQASLRERQLRASIATHCKVHALNFCFKFLLLSWSMPTSNSSSVLIATFFCNILNHMTSVIYCPSVKMKVKLFTLFLKVLDFMS